MPPKEPQPVVITAQMNHDICQLWAFIDWGGELWWLPHMVHPSRLEKILLDQLDVVDVETFQGTVKELEARDSSNSSEYHEAREWALHHIIVTS